MKYQVSGAVSGGIYIGEFDAATPEEAAELALDEADTGLCYHCHSKVSDLAVVTLVVEDEDGEVTEVEL